ncbi:protein tyrosine phosphatase [Oscillochloris trichoides DG-6]|uniref:Protein tyrosine phosphatase n=1 Tax=Oscillochloris trichoides DG-6 TaxID=765420 RepID=E1IEY6_9CHLR|nr:protein-tyrosine-phosphatase [Oscillochloris trichoides]EFO80283.1 protein tyrosine phosphatase [Oscillochloris trichoides DG-6]
MKPRTLLFICTGNYYRSRYAELLFNALVPTQLGWCADSRGFAPGPWNNGPVAPVVLERLRAAALPIPDALREPLRLSRADLEAANLLIALDEREHRPYVEGLGSAWVARFIFWQIPDLHEWPASRALDAIEDAVVGLIAQIR